MTLEQMKSFVDRQRWIFAKTYADRAPHEYMLLKELDGDKEEYYDFVRTVLEKGIVMKFWHKENRYVYLDNHMYWVMDPDPEKVILINRCNVDDYDYVIYAKVDNYKND